MSDFLGARFYKTALQVNPWSYMEKYRGQRHPYDEEEYVERIISAAVDERIECLAITDHNSVGSVALFREKAKGKPVTIFPGFEISSSEGIHILCIFDVDESLSLIKDTLVELGISGDDIENKQSKYALEDLLIELDKKSVVIIAAHITTPKTGLLTALSGRPKIKAWQNSRWDAVQIPKSIEDLEPENKKIILNKNFEYKKKDKAGETLATSVVNAYDVALPEDLKRMNASVKIKMTSPSLEGMRQAFLDPDSRIQLNYDVSTDPKYTIDLVSFNNGFFDCSEIVLSPNLNILIGGRGAGKSSLIEAFRYVFSLESQSSEVMKSHESILLDVIGRGTKVKVVVSSNAVGSSKYSIEGVVPHPPVVYRDNGEQVDIRPSDLIEGLRIYSQHELGRIVANKRSLLSLVSGHLQVDQKFLDTKNKIEKNLIQNKQDLISFIKKNEDHTNSLDELPKLEEEFQLYTKVGVSKKLFERENLQKESNFYDANLAYVQTVKESFEDIGGHLQDSIELTKENESSSTDGQKFIYNLMAVHNDFKKAIASFSSAGLLEIEKFEKVFLEKKENWEKMRESVMDEELSVMVAGLKEEHPDFDFERYGYVQSKIIQLRDLKKIQNSNKSDFDEILKKRKILIKEYRDCDQEEFVNWTKVCKKLTRKLNKKVKIEIVYQENKDSIVDLLQKEAGGNLSVFKNIVNDEKFDLDIFLEKLRSGADNFKKFYNVKSGRVDDIISKGEELFTSLEMAEIEHGINMFLNVSNDESIEWRSLDRLSKGQKATAALLVVMLDTENPLIIDQPEDDLDNQYIAEGVVPKLRERKNKKQFLISTHNANIPVLGDSELVVCMSAHVAPETGDRAVIDQNQIGAIDKESIKASLNRVLEGGSAAFLKRKNKYGI